MSVFYLTLILVSFAAFALVLLHASHKTDN